MSCSHDNLHAIAVAAAAELGELPVHAQLYLERLVFYFAEHQQDWLLFSAEVRRAITQLEADA